MSQRKNSLQAALAGAAEEVKPPKKVEKKQSWQGRAVKTQVVAKAPKEKATTTNAASSRENTVMVGGHFPKHVSRQLKMIAVEEDTTNQALIAEALDLLFTRKGKDKIADLSAG